MSKPDRRVFITGAIASLATPAFAAKTDLLADASLRGGLDAAAFGVRPGAFDDQSKAFSRLLKEASDAGKPVYLPAGEYRVSNIALPRNVILEGVPGATRIVYGGDGHFLLGEDCERIALSGLAFDGMNRWLSDETRGLVDLRGVGHAHFDNCSFAGSSKNGVVLERCAGRIANSEIAGAFDAGLWSVEGAGMTISGNRVTDCGNGGILVHRWSADEDATFVTGNRVARIRALNGGTGQNGNGINLFRAEGCIVSGNDIADCAFSAIRANSASAARIADNRCTRSGETAIYAEFAFEGATISGNIVDGAAHGISVVNFNEGGRLATVTGNVVRNLSAEGPYPPDSPGFGAGITVEADAAVTGNVVEGAPLWGIGIGWGPFLRDVAVTGNVVRDSRIGVMVSVVDGAGSALIADNVISGSKEGAIVGHRWADAVTGDLAPGGDPGYPHLTIERNRVS